MLTNFDSGQVIDITLAPGEFFFGGGRTRIHTLLGSCVAITMWHPRRLIGGMCHYLLPSRGSNLRLSQGHFADEAVSLFLNEIDKTTTAHREYEVKLFGGGNMFASLKQGTGSIEISKNNIEIGARLLRERGFQIKASDLGGTCHRRIYLELWNGAVWVQRGSSSRPIKE